jgi:1-acyl-sn-glycerol-3-phosphate acyltransferase
MTQESGHSRHPRRERVFDTSATGNGRYCQAFRHVIMAIIRAIFTPIFRFKAYDTDILHHILDTEGDPQTGRLKHGYIIACNHRSYLDPVFVLLGNRPAMIRFIAKEGFLNLPFIGYLASLIGVIPIKRDAADARALKRAVKMLKRGELVGIFPQGTRGRTHPQHNHPGIALIAQLAHASVIPVRVWNTELISPVGSHRWHFPRITLRYGEPMSIQDSKYQAMDKDERFQTFTNDVMQAIYALPLPVTPGSTRGLAPRTQQTAETRHSGSQDDPKGRA